MSNGFFTALAKMKLVEIEGDEQPAEAKKGSTIDMAEVERILAEDEARMQGQGKAPSRPPPRAQKQSAPSAPSAQPAPVRSPAGSGGIREDVPFDTYYAEGGVPPTAYGAEKLLRVLDGLRAMDPSTRKAAVLAMDAADDAWTIADVVLDAQRKSRSLERALAALDADLSAIRDSARAEKEKSWSRRSKRRPRPSSRRRRSSTARWRRPSTQRRVRRRACAPRWRGSLRSLPPS